MNESRGLNTLDKGWTLDSGYSTHMPSLIRTVQTTDKPVMELGGGVYSTPLLHWLCEEQGLELTTYENDPRCFEFCQHFESPTHKVIFVNDWSDVPMDKHFGVIFIDHAPDIQRGRDAIKFKDNADYIVMHDTGSPTKFGYKDVWEHFRYKLHWTHRHPFTTIVSNFINLKEKFNNKNK